MSRVMALALAFLLLAGCVTLAPTPRYEIVAYYPAWKGAIAFDATLVTVVNYAFLEVAEDGSLTLSQPATDRAHFETLRAVKAKHPHLRLVASVGGWTRSDRFSDMANDAAARARFTQSTVAFLRGNGFDGLDIDWEYPGAIGVPCPAGRTCDRPADKRNFGLLARELRAALDAAGATDSKRYLLTIAAGNDRSFLFDGPSSAWMADLAASLDWVNLMTYDYHGTWENAAGMLAPLHRDPPDPSPAHVDASVALYLAAGVPPRKLTLGIPFYGKGWMGCAPGPRGDALYQMCAAPVADPAEATFEFSYLTGEGYLLRDAGARYTVGGRGFTRHWSTAAGAPYLYNPQSGVFVTFDDEASVAAKARYIAARGLLGAMFWELAADREGVLARELGNLPH